MRTEEFIEAIKQGDLARVSSLLDAEPSLLNMRAESGASGVLLATYYGKPEIARLLLNRGAELQISEAAALGDLDRVRALVQADDGAKNAVSPDGFFPLGLASYFGHRKLVSYLIAVGADVNAASRNSQNVAPLHGAVARRDSVIVKELLKAGADPNARQQRAYTPLHVAAGNGDAETVDVLIAHGAEKLPMSEDGKTPAMLAADAGHHEIADLLSAGATSAV